MAQELDGNKVHSSSELLILVLALVEIGRGGEGVHQDECGLRVVVGMRHLIACGDTAQMGDTNGFGIRHCVIFKMLLCSYKNRVGLRKQKDGSIPNAIWKEFGTRYFQR